MRASASPMGSEWRPPYFVEFVEGRRGEILDAALSVFVRKGYEGGTMREIAAALGVSEPALYRHYQGKEAIYIDLVATAGDRIVEGAASQMERVDLSDVRESVRSLFGEAPRQERAAIIRTLLVAAPHQPVLLETFRAHLARPMFAAISRLVPRVDAASGIEADGPEARARARRFMGTFIGHFMTGMMLDLPDDDDDLIEGIMAAMRWGDAGASGVDIRPQGGQDRLGGDEPAGTALE